MMNRRKQHPSSTGTRTLQTRLEFMRSRAMGLLLVYGISFALVILVLWVLALVFLDWLFWFPSSFRLVLAGSVAVIAAVMLFRYLILPQRRGFSLLHIASRIEQRFSQFDDRLTSSISFLSDAASLEDALRQELIEQTQALAREIPIESAISSRPAARMAVFGTVSLLLLGTVSFVGTEWMRTGVARLFNPMSDVEWPRLVEIRPLTGDVTIARGAPVVLAMNIIRGQEQAPRGYLLIQKGWEAPERIPLRREGETRYAATCTGITQESRYWFEAGDDTTRNRPHLIRVVDRPRVEDVQLGLVPPVYTGKPMLSVPASQERIELIRGSRLVISFATSKPVAQDDQGGDQAWLEVDDGASLHALPTQNGRYEVAWEPDQDGHAAVRMVDRDGLSNVPTDEWRVVVQEDRAPVIHIREPERNAYVTSQARITIAGSATDDLQVTAVVLQATVPDRNQSLQLDIPLPDDIENTLIRSEVDFEYIWELSHHHLQVGDTMEVELVARDNRQFGEWTPQVARSQTLQLSVVTPEEFRAGISRQIHRLAQGLERVVAQQARLQRDTENLRDSAARLTALAMEDRLLRLSVRQLGVVDTLKRVHDQAQQLDHQMSMNNVKGGREPQQTQLILLQLRDMIEPLLREAAVACNQARQRESERGVLEEIVELQEAAMVELRRLLANLQTWDDYNSVLAQLRNLVDLQQKNTQKTALFQQQNLGQPLAELTEDARAQLDELGAGQNVVTEGLRKSLEQTDLLQARLRDTEPAEANALAEARSKMISLQLVPLSTGTEQSIRQNQTARAQSNQVQIERSLAQVIQQLEDKEGRQLAQLSKRLQDARDLIQRLLDEQKRLRDLTRTMDRIQKEPLARQGSAQRQLKNSTVQAIRIISAIPDSESISSQMQFASQAMEDASESLYDGHPDDAELGQTQAIERLETALNMLDTLQKKNQLQIQQHEIFLAQKALEGIRRLQAALNDATHELVRQIQDQQRLSRRLLRQSRARSDEQAHILERFQKLEENFQKAPVYLWMIQRIGGAMVQSRDLLRDRPYDPDLEKTQARVLTLLDQLIDALKAADVLMQQQEFAMSSGGDGGGGQKQQGELQAVPTVAELLVLKSIQQDILSQTREIHAAAEEAPMTEQQLEAIRNLGVQQQQLERMTEALTQQARTGRPG